MQTQLLIKQVRELTQEMQEECIQARSCETSPDYKAELQLKMDKLLRTNHNPTLSCVLNLREAADSLNLDLSEFAKINYEREVAWQES